MLSYTWELLKSYQLDSEAAQFGQLPQEHQQHSIALLVNESNQVIKFIVLKVNIINTKSGLVNST